MKAVKLSTFFVVCIAAYFAAQYVYKPQPEQVPSAQLPECTEQDCDCVVGLCLDTDFVKSELSQIPETALSEDSASPENIYQRGILYFTGTFVAQDRQKAFRLFQGAARAGNVKAMYMVADCLASGLGVTEDHEKAYTYYLKAAEHGFTRAMKTLGFMYLEGYGVEPNQEKSDFWYAKFKEATRVG